MTNFFLVISTLLAVVQADVMFKPVSRELRGSNGLNGLWGSLHQLGSCVQKIEDASDETAGKTKFMPCDDWEPKQMWKFQSYNDDAWTYTGLLYNMDGGCLAIRGPVAEGKSLKVMRCDESNPKQQWWSDGDTLTPLEQVLDPTIEDYLCVSGKGWEDDAPIKPRDPVTLMKCEDTTSLDY